jgi:hypothetical protein
LGSKTWERSSDKWFREITTAGLISIPIVEPLLIARQDSRVRDLVGHHNQLLFDSVIHGVSGFEGMFHRIGDAGYYMTPLDEARVEALNHMALYAVALARLYELTSEEAYLTRVGEIASFWLASTTHHSNNTLSWPYAPSSQNMHANAEPFWKASVTIELPIVAYRIGTTVTDKHLLKIQRILSLNIFENAELSDSVDSIDGQEKSSRISAKKIKKRPVLTMWHLLDCFFPPIVDLDRALFSYNPLFYKHSSRSYYGAVFGLYARTNGCRFE